MADMHLMVRKKDGRARDLQWRRGFRREDLLCRMDPPREPPPIQPSRLGSPPRNEINTPTPVTSWIPLSRELEERRGEEPGRTPG
ncbi:hypothetical protein FKM82_002938 [Ascaphus truei]